MKVFRPTNTHKSRKSKPADKVFQRHPSLSPQRRAFGSEAETDAPAYTNKFAS